MKIIHILGRQNNGKTTLIVDLVHELIKRDIRVGTLKHSSHEHELDRPGKDSYLHRMAGACPAAIATKNMMAVYIPRHTGENPFDKLDPLFHQTDLILVEGYLSGPGKKIEVWRKSAASAPLFLERKDIEAVISDDDIETTLPVWPRNNIAFVADQILKMAGERSWMQKPDFME
jgi:molybdopterin-guanine dinucleotide biosynthesis adapter protein